MNGWVKPAGANRYHFYLAGEDESLCTSWRRSAMPAPKSDVLSSEKCDECARLEKLRRER